MADTGTEKLLINLFCYNLTINTGVDTRVVTLPPGTLYIWRYCDEYAIFGEVISHTIKNPLQSLHHSIDVKIMES